MPLYYDAELRAGADYRPEPGGSNAAPAWADDFVYVSHVVPEPANEDIGAQSVRRNQFGINSYGPRR